MAHILKKNSSWKWKAQRKEIFFCQWVKFKYDVLKWDINGTQERTSTLPSSLRNIRLCYFFLYQNGQKKDSKNAKFTSSLLSQKHAYFILCTTFIPSKKRILNLLFCCILVIGIWSYENVQEFPSIILRKKRLEAELKDLWKKKKQNLLSAVDQKAFLFLSLKFFFTVIIKILSCNGKLQKWVLI